MAVVVAIHGPSGSGKTTLIEQLTSRLVSRGVKIGVIKHTHKGFSLDQHGKDSQRFWESGAQAVLAAGPQELFLRQRSAWSHLSELLGLLPQELDCVFIEGFTRSVAAIDIPVAVQVEIAQEGVRLNGQALRGDLASAAVEAAVMGHLNHDRVAVASRAGHHGRR
ncbi:MAG: molybdopterin-guanine dinucleotide biosynthesis protein B [Candidatus Omnitrophica bacterium]|nr:molybdopterin-guanine dinucleotide biosynthesis protein B [Candidatus Omnitrophota bacterium]